jgi:hypothetical protein
VSVAESPSFERKILLMLLLSGAITVSSPILRSRIVPQALTVVVRVGVGVATLDSVIVSPHVGA